MRRTPALGAAAGFLLVALPMAGVVAAGLPVSRYLEFPPKTRYVVHAPFSLAAFAAGALFLAAVLYPFLARALRSPAAGRDRRVPVRPFPAWGWAGAAFGAASWLLAWSRFPRLAPLQPHTFTFLWAAYIVVVNALLFRRTGTCPMLARPRSFALLFAGSAAFWWFFEYLNRFVQNWHYAGVEEYSAWGYFEAATVPFSTVLPAVLSTRDLVAASPRLGRAFSVFLPLRFRRPKPAAGVVLALSAAGLAGIGVWPDFLYPLLWVSPLLVLVSLQVLAGEPHVLSGVPDGDWTGVVSAALAGLVCGFFWEMWNVFSQAKWIYAVPYVGRFRVFEMPLLGYGGYLPFGLECAAIGALFGWRDANRGKAA